MKYELDCESTVDKSLLFWISRFIKYKITTLSNRQVSNKEHLAKLLQDLTLHVENIKQLKVIVKDIRNAGINGIHLYFIPIEKLYRYLLNYGSNSLKEIDEEFLSEFLAIETSTLSDATKKNYRIALLSFFAFLDKQNDEKYSFLIELKNWGGLSGKSGEKLPSYMQKDEVLRFIKAIDDFEFSPKVIHRNRLIIKMILYTGIRVGEALGINIKDIFVEGEFYMIQVRGKGNKPRIVMIKKSIISTDLQVWSESRNCENTLLFCNKFGKKLTQAYISRIVEKILLSANIKKEKNGAHMLRHTFATMLYQKNHDLILVQESLGHADINTSRIYTHFDQEKLKKTTDIY
ncbi:MAG: tyrosine-type recombinase/integrase [Campylobacteraceae bacterium]|nr:tyrosine-type recombinase/integrase [Campylobacteraceae bacterium]